MSIDDADIRSLLPPEDMWGPRQREEFRRFIEDQAREQARQAPSEDERAKWLRHRPASQSRAQNQLNEGILRWPRT